MQCMLLKPAGNADFFLNASTPSGFDDPIIILSVWTGFDFVGRWGPTWLPEEQKPDFICATHNYSIDSAK